MSTLPEFARFYMVCRKPTHAGARTKPKQRYSSHEDAMRAAVDLATAADHPFIVLTATDVVKPGDSATGTLDLGVA